MWPYIKTICASHSMVEIQELNNTHSGEWSCLVQGEKGNHTRTVSIYVIAHDTKYCPTNGKCLTVSHNSYYLLMQQVLNFCLIFQST